jgi:hypothetical protein
MSLRSLILRNFWWKLLSLLLATLIWFNIRASIGRGGDLQFENTAAGLAPTSVLSVERRIDLLRHAGAAARFAVEPLTAQVSVRGAPGLLRSLKGDEIRLFVEVDAADGAGGDEEAVFARVIHVQLPPGVVLGKIEPAAAVVRRLPGPASPATPPSHP